MKTKKAIVTLGLLMASLVFVSPVLLAGEHGGKEHGGAEHGGAAIEGSHEGSHGMAEEGDAAVLNEAAEALKGSHPELAAKLEAIAKKHQ